MFNKDSTLSLKVRTDPDSVALCIRTSTDCINVNIKSQHIPQISLSSYFRGNDFTFPVLIQLLLSDLMHLWSGSATSSSCCGPAAAAAAAGTFWHKPGCRRWRGEPWGGSVAPGAKIAHFSPVTLWDLCCCVREWSIGRLISTIQQSSVRDDQWTGMWQCWRGCNYV